MTHAPTLSQLCLEKRDKFCEFLRETVPQIEGNRFFLAIQQASFAELCLVVHVRLIPYRTNLGKLLETIIEDVAPGFTPTQEQTEKATRYLEFFISVYGD